MIVLEQRVRQGLKPSYLTSAAANIKGLQGTVQYLDSLRDVSNPQYAMALAKSKIDLL